MNLQDGFLNQLRLSKAPVKLYLTGGQQLKGVIRAFDNFSILLESSGMDNLVYKHAVSTITPQEKITGFLENHGKPHKTEET